MEVALTPSLRDVRLAALLVHALPDRVLALDDAGGGRVLVGFRRRADLSPCALRETVASVLADGDLPALGPALGLRRGPLRARILEDELDERLGGVLGRDGAPGSGTTSPDELLRSADRLWSEGRKAEAQALYRRLKDDFQVSLAYQLNKDRIKERARARLD